MHAVIKHAGVGRRKMKKGRGARKEEKVMEKENKRKIKAKRRRRRRRSPGEGRGGEEGGTRDEGSDARDESRSVAILRLRCVIADSRRRAEIGDKRDNS